MKKFLPFLLLATALSVSAFSSAASAKIHWPHFNQKQINSINLYFGGYAYHRLSNRGDYVNLWQSYKNAIPALIAVYPSLQTDLDNAVSVLKKRGTDIQRLDDAVHQAKSSDPSVHFKDEGVVASCTTFYTSYFWTAKEASLAELQKLNSTPHDVTYNQVATILDGVADRGNNPYMDVGLCSGGFIS